MAVRLAYADRWRFFKTRFRLLRNAAFLVGLSALDIRDLWYKLTWVGAYDAFAFTAGSRGTLVPTPLPLKNPLPTPFTHYETEQFSGWPSYLSRCETLAPFCSPGSTFFLNAMGSNCQVGVKGENKTIERLVMTSNVRTDSMAWAACRLLYGHRRPAICQQTIVSRFEERYHFEAMPVESEWLAPVDSAAETELLRFLELIAMSHPRYKVVCTGGLAYTTPGEYKPTIFGCASANVFRAEYAGVYATHFHQLAFNKAWLTDIDVITLADVSYKIRQNTINVFTMEEEQDADGKVVVSITESTMNNFVSTGLLYMLMIIIDMILLLSQMYTGVELVTQWILPVMRQRDPSAFDLEDDASLEPVCAADTKDIYFTQEEYASFLTSSLYLQPVIVFLTVVSQLISWGIIIPNSVVWTWSLSNYSKAMAFASSLRLWTLILIALNIVWDTVVFFFEKKAYAFARATFVSTFEVIAVGVIVAFAHKSEVMAISEAKFGVERQWINDLVSFPSYIAHGNTFNEDLDHVSNSSPGLLKVMYAPLLKIVFHSVLATYRVLGIQQTRGNEKGKHAGIDRKVAMDPAHIIDQPDHNYRRLPLETLLGVPMRARSLVRSTLSMQKTVNGEVLLRPTIHLDFGLYVHDRKVIARSGFWTTLRSIVSLPIPPGASRTSTRVTSIATIDTAGLRHDDQVPRQRHADHEDVKPSARGRAIAPFVRRHEGPRVRRAW